MPLQDPHWMVNASSDWVSNPGWLAARRRPRGDRRARGRQSVEAPTCGQPRLNCPVVAAASSGLTDNIVSSGHRLIGLPDRWSVPLPWRHLRAGRYQIEWAVEADGTRWRQSCRCGLRCAHSRSRQRRWQYPAQVVGRRTEHSALRQPNDPGPCAGPSPAGLLDTSASTSNPGLCIVAFDIERARGVKTTGLLPCLPLTVRNVWTR